MAELEISPYVRAALAEAVVVATQSHIMTGLMYEVWELAKEVGRSDYDTPWTPSRNPFGQPERFVGRLPDLIGTDELHELLYGAHRAPQEPLWAPQANPAGPTTRLQ